MSDFSQMYRFSHRLRDFPVRSRPLIKGLMNVAAKEGEAVSKATVAVRTGYLQSKILFHATTDRGWTFLMKAEAAADYATFQEEGTSRMPPRPFMAPGVEHAADEIETLLGVMVEEYL